MKILLMGDSITDMSRDRSDGVYGKFGMGYPIFIQGELSNAYPEEYEIVNRGISGNRVVDIYARIKADCWNLKPDVVSILIGVNDVWHEVASGNGVEIDRYERVYRTYLEETKKVLPNVKFILVEPFVLKGSATEEKFDDFLEVKEYAKVVKKIAKDFDAPIVLLQDKIEEVAKKYGKEYWLADGVHPTVAGAKFIADQWLKVFKENFIK